MGYEMPEFLNRLGLAQSLKRWTRALQVPGSIVTRDLKAMYRDMRATRDRIDVLAATAQTELLTRVTGKDGIERPDQCDWAVRPGPWCAAIRPAGHVDVGSPFVIGSGVTLFHDAVRSDLSVRQVRAHSGLVGPKFGLVLEVYRFDGSFVSLVQDLPAEALEGLTLNHFIAVHLQVTREQPLEIYARLNVQHGPNHEQVVRQFSFEGDRGLAEFDLAYTKINEKRLEKAWLDLILEGPEMNRVEIQDMVLLRAPRADF